MMRRCPLQSILVLLMHNRWHYFGHISRRHPREFTRDALTQAPLRRWKKHRNRQLSTWFSTVRADPEVFSGQNFYELRQLTKGRF